MNELIGMYLSSLIRAKVVTGFHFVSWVRANGRFIVCGIPSRAAYVEH